MGFATGFTGGVTLTLGVACLTVLAHQRNREQQAAILRHQTYLLSGIVDPLPPILPPTRAELAAAERANFTEAAKDRWNAEVENAAKWALSKDWSEVRENFETVIGRLWGRSVGRTSDGQRNGGEKDAAPVRDLSSRPKEEPRDKSDGVAAAAKAAYVDAKAKSAELASKAEEKAGATKDTIKGAIHKGVEKSRELLGQSNATAIGADGKMMDLTVSPIEKALQQRYEEPSGLTQTVEEVLAARYAPFDAKANASPKPL
ncbi:hypothetical protein F4861DRAFT_505476 [Xylaria intraflava]|nr:hypothetical protein F4861DRAFT_505476 [Xylaria intraflava]